MWYRDPSYDYFHAQHTYHQAQLALAVLPRKAEDIHDCFANVHADVYRLLLRSLEFCNVVVQARWRFEIGYISQ